MIQILIKVTKFFQLPGLWYLKRVKVGPTLVKIVIDVRLNLCMNLYYSDFNHSHLWCRDNISAHTIIAS